MQDIPHTKQTKRRHNIVTDSFLHPKATSISLCFGADSRTEYYTNKFLSLLNFHLQFTNKSVGSLWYVSQVIETPQHRSQHNFFLQNYVIVGVTCSSERSWVSQLSYESTSGSYICTCNRKYAKAGDQRDEREKQVQSPQKKGKDKSHINGWKWQRVCALHYWECPKD